jgi:hypothetical protein
VFNIQKLLQAAFNIQRLLQAVFNIQRLLQAAFNVECLFQPVFVVQRLPPRLCLLDLLLNVITLPNADYDYKISASDYVNSTAAGCVSKAFLTPFILFIESLFFKYLLSNMYLPYLLSNMCLRFFCRLCQHRYST